MVFYWLATRKKSIIIHFPSAEYKIKALGVMRTHLGCDVSESTLVLH